MVKIKNKREILENEAQAYSGPLFHIAEQNDDPVLSKIDALYAAADALSVKNAIKHRRILWGLSAVGTLITLLFLLYDEAELYGLIFACGAMVLSLFFIRLFADHSECHRKYLEYRVLAESLRVQYFLFLAGVKDRVSELMPWSIRQEIPWVTEILSTLPIPRFQKKESVLDSWIKDQKAYHELKLKQSERKHRRDNLTASATVVVTIIAYATAMIFEIIVFHSHPDTVDVNLVRAILKIIVGTMSAVTLFTGNYYGKMSLPNIIDDHRRMAALFETAEIRVRSEGETRELLLFLARECINENSTWYAYQNKNKPDLVI